MTNKLIAREVLASKHLELRYDRTVILPDMNVAIYEKQITALVGANGSGKSTLLKALARLLKPQAGSVYLDGQAIARLPAAEVARRMAILPQSPDVPSSLTVHELVEQGRYPHAGPLKMLRKQDHAAIDRAMSLTGMSAYRNRLLDSLSGGERQRAWIALALAQSTPILLLDEPTTYLDIRHQLEIMALIRYLNEQEGLTVVVVLHDLNQAAQLADRMIVLQAGRIACDGEPGTVMTADMLNRIFGIHASIVEDPASGKPYFIPHHVVGPPSAGRQAGD